MPHRSPSSEDLPVLQWEIPRAHKDSINTLSHPNPQRKRKEVRHQINCRASLQLPWITGEPITARTVRRKCKKRKSWRLTRTSDCYLILVLAHNPTQNSPAKACLSKRNKKDQNARMRICSTLTIPLRKNRSLMMTTAMVLVVVNLSCNQPRKVPLRALIYFKPTGYNPLHHKRKKVTLN